MFKARIWVGVDVGESISFLSVIDKDDNEISKICLPTSYKSIATYLEDFDGFEIVQIAIESSNAGTHLVRKLREKDLPVEVYETRRASKYLRVRGNKTDGNDARGLAEIAKLGRSVLTKVHLKSPAFQKLRSELMFRHKLTLHRVACEAMIRSFIKLNGGTLKSVTSARTLRKHVGDELTRMKMTLGVDLAKDVEPLLELACGLRQYLTTVEAHFTAFANKNPVCSRFLEIPGVGPICAVSFYSAIEDPARFSRAIDVGPYLGMVPTVAQSGKSIKYGRISKRGNKLTRTHLTLAAGALLNRCKDNPLQIWGKNLEERVGHGKARVALARKLAVLMMTIWKSGERYDPSRLVSRKDADPPVAPSL